MSRYNAIYGEVARVFFNGRITKRNEKRAGMLAYEVDRMHLPPCAVGIRKSEHERRWPDIVCTPESLLKHLGYMTPPDTLNKFAKLLKAEKGRAVECANMNNEDLFRHYLERHHTVERAGLRQAWIDYLVAIGRTLPDWLKPDNGQMELPLA